MVVHVYEYFVYVVGDSMKLKNFDYKICKHMVVLVKKKEIIRIKIREIPPTVSGWTKSGLNTYLYVFVDVV
jgi:hypothetical protein